MFIFEKIKSVARDSLPNNINRLATLGYRLKALLYYRWVFASFGSRSYLRTPCLLSNVHFMHIGNNCSLAKGARLEVVLSNATRSPELRIGDNVNIEQNAHITCHNRIIIESDVSIAHMCTITDTTHPIDRLGEGNIAGIILDDDAIVEIGRGTTIGAGTTILPNVRIGRGCQIGANSVVTQNIPDLSVAAGSPARVLRSLT